jgi:hypothetical protein
VRTEDRERRSWSALVFPESCLVVGSALAQLELVRQRPIVGRGAKNLKQTLEGFG